MQTSHRESWRRTGRTAPAWNLPSIVRLPLYRRIPEYLVPALAHGLVGLLHIRFSPLWQPAAEALGACLKYKNEVRARAGCRFWVLELRFRDACLLVGVLMHVCTCARRVGAGDAIHHLPAITAQ